jgi:hypothetical protein
MKKREKEKIKEALKEVQLIREGKLKKKTWMEVKAELIDNKHKESTPKQVK